MNSEFVNNMSISPESIVSETGINPTICELLREAHRVNSININLNSATAHLLIPKCKDIIRRHIFELNIAGQTLWAFNEEIYQRELEQTNMYRSFRPDVYMKGAWLKPLSRPLTIIKPGGLAQQQQRIIKDYNHAWACLMNAADVLKKIGEGIETLRIDPASSDSLNNYANAKKALDDITGNLIRMSEDLYIKANSQFLPEHYYTFYEYLINGSFVPYMDIRALIKKREDMLAQVLYLRD
jgi:hypothetical protein